LIDHVIVARNGYRSLGPAEPIEPDEPVDRSDGMNRATPARA
jgi:hypothetical protein